jgi:hypothetical protein
MPPINHTTTALKCQKPSRANEGPGWSRGEGGASHVRRCRAAVCSGPWFNYRLSHRPKPGVVMLKLGRGCTYTGRGCT